MAHTTSNKQFGNTALRPLAGYSQTAWRTCLRAYPVSELHTRALQQRFGEVKAGLIPHQSESGVIRQRQRVWRDQ